MISLINFITENPLSEKILFVNNKKIMKKEFERLALKGIDVFSVKLKTIDEFLIKENILNNLTSENFERLVLGLQETGNLKYYDRKFNSPIFFNELKKVIFRIRLSGFKYSAMPSSCRLGEILKILEAYERDLEVNRLVDYPTLLERGVEKTDTLFAVPSDLLVHKLERDFLDSLSPQIIKFDGPSSHPPKSFYINSPVDTSNKGKDIDPVYRSYFSEIEELSSIFEEIAEEDISPQSVEIVVNSTRLLDKVLSFGDLFGVKIYSEDKLLKKDSNLSSLLALLKSFVEENGNFQVFKEIIEGPYFESDSIDFIGVYNDLRKKNFLSGRWNYQVEKGVANDFLQDFISLFPKNIFSIINYSKELERLLDFFNNYLKREIFEENAKFFQNLENAKESSIYEEMSYSLFIDRLVGSIESQEIEQDIDPPYVLVRQSYGPFTRDYAYILGMTSSSYPSEIQESKILSDMELMELSKDIITAMDEIEADLYYFKKMLESYRGKGRLRLSYSRQDPATGLENILHILFNNKKITPGDYPGNVIQIEENIKISPLDEKSRARNRSLIENYVFSYTSLDELMTCPKCFYFKRIWGLDSEIERESEKVDPLEIGNLYHYILDAFIKWGRGQEELIPNNARVQLIRIIDEEIKKYKGAFPPKRQRFLEDTITETRENILRYFDEVLIGKLQHFKSMETERPFQNKIRVGKYELNFRGRIDRVEYYKDQIVLVDLKTGKRQYKEEDIAKNKSYQDFVYKRVLEDGRDFKTEYHFLNDDNIILAVEDNPEIEKKIELTIDLILEYGFISSTNFGKLPEKYNILRLGEKETTANHRFTSFLCRG